MEALAPRLLTNADLDALDVPFLRELHEGVLYVTPSPAYRHQHAVSRFPGLFGDLLPEGLIGLVEPFDYQPDDHTTDEPDYSVWDGAEVERRPLDVAPVLAVEVRTAAPVSPGPAT